MKITTAAIFTSLLFIFSSTTHAFTMSCRPGWQQNIYDVRHDQYHYSQEDDRRVWLYLMVEFECTSKRGKVYYIKSTTAGPVIWLDIGENYSEYRLTCPFMKEKRLEKVFERKEKLNFGGFHISVGGFLIGNELGLNANSRAGLCFLTSANPAIGAGLSFDQLILSITPPPSHF